MLATAGTFTLDGIEARPVRVEVHVDGGLPSFSIVGLPDTAVREARERVRSALGNSDLGFPQSRITVNLAPAHVRKAGPGLDLAIAAALLGASGSIESDGLDGVAVAGELALDGSVRSIAGVLALAEAARAGAARALVVPEGNGPEAALVDGLEVLPIGHLRQLVEYARGEWRPHRPQPLPLRTAPDGAGPDLADLRGQPGLRRALEVAAAGGHSLLMIGPPGAGKTLAARRLPSILPPLDRDEALEVARIASACGRLASQSVGTRPFRAPHHTVSYAGLVGGGSPPRAGEVTLAHRGVLFLDELAEFQRQALESLRSPLEEGSVTVARAGRSVRLPCRFTLVAAANACPCGRGGEDAECRCAAHEVLRYQARLSGALSDRVDICAVVAQPSGEALGGERPEGSDSVRARVSEARRRQARRLGRGRCNAEMEAAEVRACEPSPEARRELLAGYGALRLSGRGHDRVLRLARTIADLAGAERIEAEHVGEAIQLRRREAPR